MDVEMDQDQFLMRRTSDGAELELTRAEFMMVSAFVRRPHMVRSRDQLQDDAFGRNSNVYERTIDSHIKRIRIKLKPFLGYDPIRTRYGFGYAWVPRKEAP